MHTLTHTVKAQLKALFQLILFSLIYPSLHDMAFTSDTK